MKSYTHKGIDFLHGGGLNVFVERQFLPLKLQLNNNSPSWRLDRNTWLSIKQLKDILKNKINLHEEAVTKNEFRS